MICLLIAAYSLVGGSVKAVPGANFSMSDPPQYLEEADEAHTPGADPWYVEVSSLKVPSDWSVWTNGFVCTNDDWKPQVEHRADCGNLDLALTFGGHGPEVPFRENQFDVGWETNGVRYYALAHGSETRSCTSLYGHPLYQMRAHKPDIALRTGLASSFCAYWERLRVGNACDNDYSWDTEEWGSTDPDDSTFRYDTTNYFGIIDNIAVYRYYPWEGYPESRLIDYENVKTLIDHVDRMRRDLTVVVDYGLGNIGSRMHDVAFLHRPGWLTHPWFQVFYDYADPSAALVGWSSTVLPPFVEQRMSDGTNVTYRPAERDFVLMPKFTWRDKSIAYTNANGILVAAQRWQCSAFTLGGLWNGEEHPVRHLYEAVGHHASAGPLSMIRNYELKDPYNDYISNTYARCMRSLPSPIKCVQAYSNQCWGLLAHSRKLTPGQLVGVNHVLGVMDRIVDVPLQKLFSEVYRCSYATSATYSLQEPVYVECTFNPDAGTFTVAEAKDFRVVRTDEDSHTATPVSFSGEDWLRLKLNPVVDSVGMDDPPSGNASAEAGFGRNFARHMIELCEGHTVRITSVVPIEGDLYNGGFRIFWRDVDGWYEYDEAISFDFQGGMITVGSGIPVRRSWRTEEPWDFRREIGPRPESPTEVGYLARRDVKDAGETTVEYKSDCSKENDFETIYGDLLDEQQAEAKRAHPGYDDPDPDSGLGEIPTINELRTIPGGVFKADGDVEITVTWPQHYTHGEMMFYGDITNEFERTLLQTNTTYIATNSNWLCKGYATVVSNVTEEGWTFVEGWTNITERQLVGGWGSESTKESEAVLVHAVTNTSPCVFFDCQRDQTVYTLYTFVTSNTLYQTVHTNLVDQTFQLWVTNIVNYYTNFVITAAVTNVVHELGTDSATNVNISSFEYSENFDVYTDLTGNDAIERGGFDMIYTEEDVELTDEYRGDGVHYQFYVEPHTSEEIYVETTPDYTTLGYVGISVIADMTNNPPLKIDLPQTMSNEYSSAIRCLRIFAKDLDLETMKLKE